MAVKWTFKPEAVTIGTAQGVRQLPGEIQFPLLLEAKAIENPDAVQEWLKNNEAEIRRLQALHGAVMFRGFPMRSAEDFNTFVHGFNRPFITEFMGGGGPRKLILGPIHTSTETPANLSIPFHHELSYLPPSFTPAQLCFFCVIPSATEGETPVLPSWLLYEQIKSSNPAFVERLRQRRVRYIRKIADRSKCANTLQRCWQDIFSAETREDAERNAVRCGHD